MSLYFILMWRAFLVLVACLSVVTIIAAQEHPKVSLALPPGIASETVDIRYFLSGPFGGYGNFVKTEKNKAMYEIDPFVNGEAAENVKIIAYLPGCEVLTFDLPFSETPIERALDCYSMGSIPLRGELRPASLVKGQEREIAVNYSALWAFDFFGIKDGPEITIPLGAVRLDPNGKFEITIPDLYSQALLRKGELHFILREVTTNNLVAFLKPAEAQSDFPEGTPVQASYPVVQLTSVPPSTK